MDSAQTNYSFCTSILQKVEFYLLNRLGIAILSETSFQMMKRMVNQVDYAIFNLTLCASFKGRGAIRDLNNFSIWQNDITERQEKPEQNDFECSACVW